MTPGTELATGGTWAAVGATGVGAIFLALKVWRAIRQEFSGANLEKTQEGIITRSITRTQDLEGKIEAIQTKYNEQSVALGNAQGEAKAYKLQIESMTSNKDYWKERALGLEKANDELERAVDILTAHMAQLQIKISADKGDIDPASVVENSLPKLPDDIASRIKSSIRIAQ